MRIVYLKVLPERFLLIILLPERVLIFLPISPLGLYMKGTLNWCI